MEKVANQTCAHFFKNRVKSDLYCAFFGKFLHGLKKAQKVVVADAQIMHFIAGSRSPTW